jgi:hypothetical protein
MIRKTDIFINAIGCAIGLTLSNFTIQYFTSENYILAIDRSFFQLVALFTITFNTIFILKVIDNE